MQSFDWIWNLKKGDKVWVVLEESITQTERFHIDFLEQTGPSEFEEVDAIFVPYEMEVVSNWVLQCESGDARIVSFQFTEPKKFSELKFACQCNTGDLQYLFGRHVGEDNTVLCSRIFQTKEESDKFCKNQILRNYTTLRCDSLIEGLAQMIYRVNAVRRICELDESGNSI